MDDLNDYDDSTLELVALQLVKCHVDHVPCSLLHPVDVCSKLFPLVYAHSWLGAGNTGSNYEHMHGPMLTSFRVFFNIGYLLRELDKS
jgi:hypothetical protein